VTGEGVCDAGTCVECTSTAPGACGMKDGTPLVCDTLKRTCTMTKQHSADVCSPCVSDAECALGEMCVLDTFASASSTKNVGYFCHWKQGDTAHGAPSDCAAGGQPYVGVVSNAKSIDGEMANICTLRVSSCPALSDFNVTNCAPTGTPNDALCGFSPPEDAKCAPFGATGYRCTMKCASSDDCPGGLPCPSSTFLCKL
jgi:hypothetical protein